MMDYTTLPTMLGKADLKAGYLSKLENLWGHHSGRGKPGGEKKKGSWKEEALLLGIPMDLVGFYALDRAFCETKRFRLRKAAGLSMARRVLSPSISVANHGSFMIRRES